MGHGKHSSQWTSDEFDAWILASKFKPHVVVVLHELKRTAERYNSKGAGWTERLLESVADAVGLSRRRLNEILAELREQGIIKIVYRKCAPGLNAASRFYLTQFMAFVRKVRSEQKETCEIPPKRVAADRNHTNVDSKISTVQSLNNRIWEIPKTGSIKNGPLQKTITDNLPANEKNTCTDFVIGCFRELVSKDENMVTVARLIGFCRRFRGPVSNNNEMKRGLKTTPPSKAQDGAPSVIERPASSPPALRGDCWDDVAMSVYRRDPSIWENWFRDLVVTASQGHLKIEAKTSFAASYIQTHFGNMIEGITARRASYGVQNEAIM